MCMATAGVFCRGVGFCDAPAPSCPTLRRSLHSQARERFLTGLNGCFLAISND